MQQGQSHGTAEEDLSVMLAFQKSQLMVAELLLHASALKGTFLAKQCLDLTTPGLI